MWGGDLKIKRNRELKSTYFFFKDFFIYFRERKRERENSGSGVGAEGIGKRISSRLLI